MVKEADKNSICGYFNKTLINNTMVLKFLIRIQFSRFKFESMLGSKKMSCKQLQHLIKSKLFLLQWENRRWPIKLYNKENYYMPSRIVLAYYKNMNLTAALNYNKNHLK